MIFLPSEFRAPKFEMDGAYKAAIAILNEAYREANARLIAIRALYRLHRRKRVDR